LHAPDPTTSYAHPARLILILSLAPTVCLGIGRFAYSLVLPDMRDSLGWSYSAAGFMNTINAAGYLASALVASKFIKRFGLSATVRGGTLACLVSLALCALSGNFVVLSLQGCWQVSARQRHSLVAPRWRRRLRNRRPHGRIFC